MTAAAQISNTYFKLKNTREQDIMLLAKCHYRPRPGMQMAEAARLIVGIHNEHDPHKLPWTSAAHCVLGDLRRAGLLNRLLTNEHSMTEFLLRDLSPTSAFPFSSQLSPDHDQPGGYHAVLIHALINHAMTEQVREEGVWLLSVKECTPDEQITKILREAAPHE